MIDEKILGLKTDYADWSSVYSEDRISQHITLQGTDRQFMGSHQEISLTFDQSFRFEAPGCIAAPIVNIISLHTISFGLEARNDCPPIKLYAPRTFRITADEVNVGDVNFLVKPEIGEIFCKTLTLFQSTEKEPEHFSWMREWVKIGTGTLEVKKWEERPRLPSSFEKAKAIDSNEDSSPLVENNSDP